MAIQHRRGAFQQFDPTRLVPGEWAVVLSGDTNASDGRAAYICFASGIVKRVSTFEDMIEYLSNYTDSFVKQVNATVDAAVKKADTAASSATSAASSATSAASSANTAASNANTARTNATNAASSANTAATSANKAASDANSAAIEARTRAEEAENAAISARAMTTTTDTARRAAETATSNANAATEKVLDSIKNFTTIVESKVEYSASDDGAIPPETGWIDTIPAAAHGQYLWTRTTIRYNQGDPTYEYSVSYEGHDGITGVMNGLFWMYVDDKSDLYVCYSDEANPPEFEYNSGTGELYALWEVD